MTGYRTIVVDACPGERLRETLTFASALANAFDADLSAASYAWPRLAFRDVMIHNALLEKEQTILMNRALAASRAVFDEVVATDKRHREWHSGIGEPAVEMGPHALTADLLIMHSGEAGPCVRASPAQIAIDYGVPVLRLGAVPAATSFASVVVAWKDSPQARRALHDALPLLARATRVTVVGVGDEVATPRLEAVAAHLRRHAVAARPCHVADRAGNVALALIEEAHREGATLVVSGAYGRPPMAERVFGGVTASLLAGTDVGWFMSN
jgi:nucleotide-binding universal stress UspA family protein